MSLNKKFENLCIYLIGSMEDDQFAEKHFLDTENSFHKAGVVRVINPCKQEQEKVGATVCIAQGMINKMRALKQDEKVDRLYEKIWQIDAENVREADILVANIVKQSTSGTTLEGTLSNLCTIMDRITEYLDVKDREEYHRTIRPWLKRVGWQKPVFCITGNKTMINGTFIHALVRASGGRCFTSVGKLIRYLKKVYK